MKRLVYEISEDNAIRYILGEYENNPMFCFGVNPSTATLEKSDTTITKVCKFAAKGSYDGYVMFNIYPVRATHIENLLEIYDVDIHKKNLEYIQSIIPFNSKCIAAWGESIIKKPYLLDLLEDIGKITKEKNISWCCLAKTKKEHPRHPSRLGYKAATYEVFELEKYVEKFRK